MAKKINVQEVKDKLQQAFGEDYDFEFGEFLLGNFDSVDAKKAGVEWIEQDGGYEGGGEYCYTIFRVHNQYYKVSFSYYSHHGFEFDYANAYEVEAVERMATFYE